MTQIVVDRFLNLKTTTTRKDLVTKFKSVDAVDRLTNLSVLNRVNDTGDLLPRALAFEYCDNSEALKSAKSSLTVVLHVLQNLYEVTPPRKQVTVPEILSQARKMYNDVSAESIDLGLYFVKEFPILESYGSTGGQSRATIIPGFEWVVIHERIVTINPEAEWDKRIVQLKTIVDVNTQPSAPKLQASTEPESKRRGADGLSTAQVGMRILQVLDEVYPDTLDSEGALRSRLPQYSETTSEEWFLALDALQKEGLIDGKFLRGSRNRIEAAALLGITPAGREWVRKNRTSKQVSVNVGDRTGFGLEPNGPLDLHPILPPAVPIRDGISPHVADLLVRAFELTEGTAELDDFNFSFTSLLLAFLAANDPLSQWFQNYLSENKPQSDFLLTHRNVTRERLEKVRQERLGPGNFQRLLDRQPPPTWTSSAQAVLSAALALKKEIGDARNPLDVRHLMGVYIFRPLGHEKQLQDWGFAREPWSRGFLSQVAQTNPEEMEAWISIHTSVFGSTQAFPSEAATGTQADRPQAPPATVTELPSVVPGTGPSTHVARDRWTIADSLGHFPYAYAIYRFLTDRETKPPLAISIQAPWGGGKSSLMRMIQSQLDPEYVNGETASCVGSAKATVGDVVKEIEPAVRKAKDPQKGSVKEPPKANGKDAAGRFRVPDLKEGGERRVTIWFNAWKYESTAQVWAGLADCIIQQIGDRLGRVERELFWFHLQLRRVDIGKVRRRIYEEVKALFSEKILPWLWAYLTGPVLALLLAIVSRTLDWSKGQAFGSWAFVITCLVDFAFASAKLKEARSEVDKNPASITLGEFVEAPDYRANLGFIHEVVEDLKRVFQVIPTKYLPMVIFIDDLDRCSPGKVADVVEALNLFLAGEFPDCMFVLGIDDEMVAAALDKAHSEVIAKLPGYARSTSIGWRFMDKFVQLPFVIPLPGSAELVRYMESLLSQGPQPVSLDMDARDLAARVVERGQDDPSKSERVVDEVASKKPLTDRQRGALKKEVEILQDMNRNIKNFSDREDQIRNLIVTGGRQFSNNPRDLKRFVNVFRFFYFLRAAREARKEPVPSLEQMSRWIALSLRWPEVVRWLRRSSGVNGFATDSVFREFENTAGAASALEPWQGEVGNTFRLKVAEAPWLADDSLYGFLRAESKLAPNERLSASSGKGFW